MMLSCNLELFIEVPTIEAAEQATPIRISNQRPQNFWGISALVLWYRSMVLWVHDSRDCGTMVPMRGMRA